ncbi:hypothetical protein RQP46_006856 [Phenoliferia psychrophenolica]
MAGGLAGTSVDTLFFPIDTLKTRLQSHAGFQASGGFSGVYRGIGSAVVGSAPGASAFFTSYEVLKQRLPVWIPYLGTESGAPFLHMMAASGGEVAACMIRVPTEVVKQRSQTGKKGSGGSWTVAKAVWTGEGLRGFYRGFATTVAREIPFTCLQFPMYERFKLILARRRTSSRDVRDLPAVEAAACGSVAGGIAAAVTTPLDVCKTRIMLSSRAPPSTSATPSVPGPKVYPTSFPRTMAIIYREEGLRALWSGVVPRVMWISLGGFVFLGVYEGSKQFLEGPPVVDKRGAEGQ